VEARKPSTVLARGKLLKRVRHSLALAFAIGFLPAAAHAQISPLIIDQNRPDRRPPSAKEHVKIPLPPARTEAPKNVAPFTLAAVQISGASIGPDRITAATKPFIGQTIDAKGVQKIADAIAAAYADSDIALYTVVIPEQDFAHGVLKVAIIEGYIEHVDIEGDITGDLDLIRIYADKLMRERPLTKTTLQRYLSLIRDIAGLKPDIQLLAGHAVGATFMQITLKQKDFQFGLGVNNNGNPELGRTQAEADVSAYDVFREGELMKLSYGTPTDPARYQYVSLSDAEPVGGEGTMIQLGASYLRTKPRGVEEPGEAESLQLLVAHPLIRSFDENLFLTAEIDGIDSDNAFLGQTFADERVRTVRAAASYSLSTPEHVLTASGTLSFGLDALGARIIPPYEAVPNFQKLSAALGYNQLLDPEWIVRLKTSGQLTPDRLPVSEYFTVGGTDYGRAFPVATIIGDNGVAASGELAWHPGQFPISWLNGSELYTFVDGGETWLKARGFAPAEDFSLASAGAGVRLAVYKDTTLVLEGARQLDVPQGLRREWTFEFAITTAQ
jgi:hemolysin activation/secretion protein